MSKPTLCLDFDGVVHSYTSPWTGAHVVPDPPVPGVAQFIRDAQARFAVVVYSSRSHQLGGIGAMRAYLRTVLQEAFGEERGLNMVLGVGFPTEKPSAFLSIDDRALTFEGVWPEVEGLLEFRPWNKRLPKVVIWRGRPVERLTREDLVEAVRQAGLELAFYQNPRNTRALALGSAELLRRGE